MRRGRWAAAVVILMAGSATERAEAQLNRSAVSVAGDDANACTVAAPCRTFNRAISQTNTGGEVVAITSGGYGPFTVDRSMTVAAAPGVYAGISVPSGDGISVQARAGSLVVLRGLTVEGLGTGTAGIFHYPYLPDGGELIIDGCVVDGFLFGIHTGWGLTIKDTVVRESRAAGIQVFFAGRATVDGVRVTADTVNFGVDAEQGGHLTLRDAVVTSRGRVGRGIGSRFDGVLAVENAVVTGFEVGVFAGIDSVTRASNTVATDNAIGFRNDDQDGAVLQSWGDNQSLGNSPTQVLGTITPVPFQ
jgi:hypothetical protein